MRHSVPHLPTSYEADGSPCNRTSTKWTLGTGSISPPRSGLRPDQDGSSRAAGSVDLRAVRAGSQSAFRLRIRESHNLSTAAARGCPSKKEEVETRCSGNSELRLAR